MSGRTPFRVLGIDPGLETTGYAVIEISGPEPVIIEAGVLQTSPKLPMPERLVRLHADLAALLAEVKPDLAAIEKLYSHYAHPQTAILMAHGRGAIILACAQAGVAVKDFPATAVKRAITGNGHASKEQVQRSIQAICRLPTLPQPPDVADALAIALCAGRHTMYA